MVTENIRQVGLRLMQTAENVYLATTGENGYPDIRSIFNLRNSEQYPTLAHLFLEHDEDYMVLISTNTSSVKVKELRRDPRAALYYCLPGQIHGMMLSGDMELLQDDELRRVVWVDGWERYYPQGYLDPDFTVLRMYPKLASGWYQADRFEFQFTKGGQDDQ